MAYPIQRLPLVLCLGLMMVAQACEMGKVKGNSSSGTPDMPRRSEVLARTALKPLPLNLDEDEAKPEKRDLVLPGEHVRVDTVDVSTFIMQVIIEYRRTDDSKVRGEAWHDMLIYLIQWHYPNSSFLLDHDTL